MKLSRAAIALLGVSAFCLIAFLSLRPPQQQAVPMQGVRILPSVRMRQVPEPAEVTQAPTHSHKNNHSKSGSGPKVTHQPQLPKSGEAVVVTVEFKQPPPSSLVLEYQVVDPGHYISLHDDAFKSSWTSMPLSSSPSDGKTDAKRSSFNATIPASVQKHRRLVRYRIRNAADGTPVAPDESDSQPNYAYFVYDGLPPWKGAINPRSSDSRSRELVTYPSTTLERVPIYHFISSRAAVEGATWTDSDQFGGHSRNEYHYTGTFVYDGVVYDHVGFRARGGGWRHAMGKNMWKFNFLPGHRFAARDDYGQFYKTKWDKLNLGACIQQADYGMRGEQGMFEAVGFRMFNLVGQEAPRTHWVHLRIIDDTQESPADQYDGDFWGLYLAVENVDEHFLKEHQLPPGNLYKIEGGAHTEFNGEPDVPDQRDVRRFLAATWQGQQPDSWWTENLDLGRYFNYRAIVECIHHYDLDAGKNYFYYHNPESKRWIVLPWDIDLTWGDHMYGGGQEPFYRAGILFRDPIKRRYQERLAEIRDLLFNPEQMSKLIDEHAALISGPAGQPSLVDADRAKWDYNPIMTSQYVLGMKAGQGRFYFGKTKNNFSAMVQYMKSYVDRRTHWIDSSLLGDYRPPPAPRIEAPGSLTPSGPVLELRLASKLGSGVKNCRWRLAEVTDPSSPTFKPHDPWHYEIQALWQQQYLSGEPAAIPTSLLQPGHTYRVRVRSQDASDVQSRWSSPVQFTIPTR